MIWLLIFAAVALTVFVLGGLDDQRRRRAEARAELTRARATQQPAPLPVTYRQAHERMHAARRALLPHIPHQHKDT